MGKKQLTELQLGLRKSVAKEILKFHFGHDDFELIEDGAGDFVVMIGDHKYEVCFYKDLDRVNLEYENRELCTMPLILVLNHILNKETTVK